MPVTPDPSPAAPRPIMPAHRHRYGGVAQALHWLTALLALAVLPLAWIAESLPREAANKGSLFVLHKSVGLTILAIVVARIVWRMFHPAPPDPGTPALLTGIGRVNHWLLYAIFLVMPVSGYLLSALSGRDTPYFWLFTVPGLPKDEALQKVFQGMHLAGQWAVYLLVALHVLATAWHVVVRRNGLHERMLPAQDRR